MDPIIFKEVNTRAGKDQPQYNTLPGYRDPGKDGDFITRWKVTFWERLRILVFGNVWMNLMTFQKPLTPSRLSTRKAAMLVPPAGSWEEKWEAFRQWRWEAWAWFKALKYWKV